MNMLTKLKHKASKVIRRLKLLRNPSERLYIYKTQFTFKNFLCFTILANAAASLIIFALYNDLYFKFSFTRLISKFYGKLSDLSLPLYIRSELFSVYSYFYQIDLDHLLDKDLENFQSFKEFFIRKIKV